MKYYLWDIDINRLFGAFDNEDEALALVRALLRQYGPAYADDLALGGDRTEGSSTEPMTGAALIARAEQRALEREEQSIGQRKTG